MPAYVKKLNRSFELWRRVLALLRYSSRRLGIMVLIATTLEIVFTIGGLLAIKLVVEAIAATENIRDNAGTLFGYIALILGLFVAGRIMQSVTTYYRSAQGYVVADYVNHTIQERAVAADLSFYDSDLYYDSLQRARQSGAQRPAQVIVNVLNVLRGGLMLLAIMVVLISVEWRLFPISLIAAGLVMAVQVRFTRERFERQRELVPKERKGLYADWLMTSEPYAKEIRLWDLGAFLRKIYMDVRVAVRQDYMAIDRRKALSESLVSVIGATLFAAAGGFILYRFSLGLASLSDLVIVVLLLLRAEAAGRTFVMSLSSLYDDQLFLSQLFRFLDLQPTMRKQGSDRPIPDEVGEGVRLNDVSFFYPKMEKPALSGVSLHVPPGRFTALVGGNGSGKTTLIKLLCRLYDPAQGTVTYDGIDVREFDPVAYRRKFSVIFQDFVKFAFSGRDNMTLSDLGRTAGDGRMVHAAEMTGADAVLSDLPKGYDTVLSRMFDGGVELSGGQWQKIALARAVFPESKFIILDEPTSAIDPNAEAALFENFRNKMDGRGALVISHRLSTIRQADYTYVLDAGRIVEEGTHDELIRLGGRYAEMFERQGRGYRA